MTKKTFPAGALLILGALAVTGPARAATPDAPLNHRFNLLGESVGAAGYDPVSYFPEGGGKPQKGLISISLEQD